MKFQIELTAEEYSTMMVALSFTEVTINDPGYAERVRNVVSAITKNVNVV